MRIGAPALPRQRCSTIWQAHPCGSSWLASSRMGSYYSVADVLTALPGDLIQDPVTWTWATLSDETFAGVTPEGLRGAIGSAVGEFATALDDGEPPNRTDRGRPTAWRDGGIGRSRQWPRS